MNIKFNQLDYYLKNFPSSINICLFLGNDEGQITLAVQAVIRYFCKLNKNTDIIKYSYLTLKETPEILCNEVKSRQLFGNKKIIVINDLTDNITNNIVSILEEKNDHNLILLRADNVKKTSKLYKTQANKNNTLTVSCYNQDQHAVSIYIKDVFRKQNIQYEENLPEYIAAALNTDFLFINTELEKLITYCDGKKVTYQDAHNILVGISLDISLFDLCHSIAIKNAKMFSEQLSRIITENTNYIMIIRVMQNYFLRIINLKNRLLQGEYIDHIINSLSPPVFYKDREKLKYAVNTIPLSRAKLLLKKLIMIEIKCKRFGIAPQLTLYNALLYI